MEKAVLQSEGITKYFNDPVTVKVLNDIDLSINEGEFVSITGKSGCGKSTLLYILSTMDTDFEGELWIDGEAMRGKTEAELARIRNEKIGFVFQFHYLLNEFSVLKNVMLPGLKLQKFSEKEVEHRAIERLKTLGIDHLALKKANQVSGGEKQRVAIARALINDPIIIMGDEPTGNLDKKNSDIVFDIFKKLCEEMQQTLLIVTHDDSFARNTHRIIEMDASPWNRLTLPCQTYDNQRVIKKAEKALRRPFQAVRRCEPATWRAGFADAVPWAEDFASFTAELGPVGLSDADKKVH